MPHYSAIVMKTIVYEYRLELDAVDEWDAEAEAEAQADELTPSEGDIWDKSMEVVELNQIED